MPKVGNFEEVLDRLWEAVRRELITEYSVAENVTDFLYDKDPDRMTAAFWTGDVLLTFYTSKNATEYNINVNRASDTDEDLFCDGISLKKKDFDINVDRFARALVTLVSIKYGRSRTRKSFLEEALLEVARRVPSEISYEASSVCLLSFDYRDCQMVFTPSGIEISKDWKILNVVETENYVWEDWDSLSSDIQQIMEKAPRS